MKHAGSKEGQDMFVSRLLGPRVFIDLGCSNGRLWNNSVMLEQMGWRGVLFDLDANAIAHCRRTRRNPCFQVDARNFDFKRCFAEQGIPHLIDYISFDVNGSTIEALANFPFEEYRFLAMTIEHDLYRGSEAIKNAIRERLRPWPEYQPLVENVHHRPGIPFEDWYVDARYLADGVQKHESAKDECWFSYLHRLHGAPRYAAEPVVSSP